MIRYIVALFLILASVSPALGTSCWNGSGACVRTDGTRSGADVWGQARDAGVNILADDHDTHDEALADGIEESLNINGENAANANISWGSNKITNLADGTAATDAANVSQIQDSGPLWLGTSSGTDTITAGVTPTLTAYATGQHFFFIKSAAANATTTPTLNINSVGAVTIVRRDNTALAIGDLPASAVIHVLYDGTSFRLLSVSERKAVPQLTTAVATTSGTTADIENIPAGACKITLSLNRVSTDGSEELLVQLGDSGGIETTDYVSISTFFDSSSGTGSDEVVNESDTGGFIIGTSGSSSAAILGQMTLTKITGTTWIASFTVVDDHAGEDSAIGAGRKTLSGELTTVRLTSDGTPDDFDNGAIGAVVELCS